LQQEDCGLYNPDVYLHVQKGMSLNVQLHTSADVFDDLQGEWGRLIAVQQDRGRSDNIFLTREFMEVWWRHLQRGQLRLLTIRDDDNVLRGIAPFFTETANGRLEVHFIGCIDVVDYLDLIIEPGHEEAVSQTVVDYLLSDDSFEWDALVLCNIPTASPTRQYLPWIARSCGLNAWEEVAEVCPVIELPNSYEDYLDGLDKKQRHELRRKRRKAEGYGVDYYIVGPEHDFDAELETFLTLMAASTPEKAEFLQMDGHRSFFEDVTRAMRNSGALSLHMLRIDETPVAAMLQFSCNGRMLLYNSGLDMGEHAFLSPGIVLLTYSIEHAINAGYSYYDFLRGDEVYKLRMGAVPSEVYTLNISR